MAIQKISNPAFSTLATEKKPSNGARAALTPTNSVRTVKPDAFVPDGRPVIREANVSTRNSQDVRGGGSAPAIVHPDTTVARDPEQFSPGGRPVADEAPSLDSFVYNRSASKKI